MNCQQFQSNSQDTTIGLGEIPLGLFRSFKVTELPHETGLGIHKICKNVSEWVWNL
jgi:hypothetical protein